MSRPAALSLRLYGFLARAFPDEFRNAYGEELLQKHVDDIMTAAVVTCAPDDTLRHVMGLMTRHHVRHLPVLDHGRLAGIISIGDVVKHRLDELQLEADVMRDAYLSTH